MKKLLKQPWFWILLIDVLFFLFNIIALPLLEVLEGILPEKTFFAMEEYYALHLQHGNVWQALLALFMFLAALSCGVWTLFARKKPILKKLAVAFIYLLLGLFSLGMLLPALGAAREKAKRIHCMSNLKQIRLLLEQYGVDHSGFYPPDLETLKRTNYLWDEECLRCPSNRKRSRTFSDYLYFGAQKKMSDPPFSMLEDCERNHPGNYRNRLFSDGNQSATRPLP